MSTASLAPGELTSSMVRRHHMSTSSSWSARWQRAESLDELGDAFTGVGRVLSVPMYGFYVLEPGTGRIEHNVGVNVSDAFVARYEAAMEFDPLIGP